MTSGLFATVRDKLVRDRDQPWRVLADRTFDYLTSLGLARLYLRRADHVGVEARTIGRPRIVNYGKMTIGDRVLLRSVMVPVELYCGVGAELHIGDQASINYGASICAMKSISIGKRARIGPYSIVMDSQFHEPYCRQQRPEPRPVVIEDDTWIAIRVSIMPGVTVGRGAIVATGAVVTHDVEPFTVVGGAPAKVIARLDPARFVVDAHQA